MVQAIGAYGSRINSTPQIDRLANEGAVFLNSFCANSICGPSRACILTGNHSHLNGVRDNAVAFDGGQPTLPQLLRAAGYQTALLGKWHLRSEPRGFDHWSILIDQGEYYNPDLIEMGERRRHAGYCTDLLTDMALAWLETGRDPRRPFFLMLHHKAPHRNWQPAPRHLRRYDGLPIPEPETLFDDYATRSAAVREQEMTVRDHLTLESDLKMGPPYQTVSRLFPGATLIPLDHPEDFFNQSGADVLLTTAETGTALTLLHPFYDVAILEPSDTYKTTCVYVVSRNCDDASLMFINYWLDMEEKYGSLDKKYQYWVLGQDTEHQTPRWSIIRDVLHWVE